MVNFENLSILMLENSEELEVVSLEDVKRFMESQDNDLLSKALSHTIEEIGLSNMRFSLENNLENIQKAHDSIHEFVYLASLCVPLTDKTSWYSKSAFLTYHWEAFSSAHRSFLEALAGYYNVAFTLLRSTHELIIKGAFFECLAHRKFRERAEVLEKDKSGRHLKDMITKTIGGKEDLEKTSATIHDMLMVTFDDKVFIEQSAYRPSVKTIVEQLSEWGMLEPIEKPVEALYNIYKKLSADVHVIPNNTDVGRRLLLEQEFYEVKVIPKELTKFMSGLHDVVDIGIVIELNTLSEWIIQDKKIMDKLAERVAVIEDLELKNSLERLKKLI